MQIIEDYTGDENLQIGAVYQDQDGTVVKLVRIDQHVAQWETLEIGQRTQILKRLTIGDRTHVDNFVNRFYFSATSVEEWERRQGKTQAA